LNENYRVESDEILSKGGGGSKLAPEDEGLEFLLGA